MDKVEIYYFSGSGNSLVVARDIAAQLNAKLTPVTSMMNQKIINVDVDIIGFVFPIYDFKPPRIFQDFIAKLNGIDSKYLFAVCTYGIVPLKSLQYFEKIIKSNGGYLAAGFAVGMPHNGIGSCLITKRQHEKMFTDWKNKLVVICDYIKAGKKGKVESSSIFFGIFQISFGFVKLMPTLVKFLSRLVFKGVNSLALTSNTHCDGCGICVRICPLNNIEMIDHRPKWSENCVTCFACLHWCPKEAISLGGLDLNIKSYHHPEVKLSDMIFKS